MQAGGRDIQVRSAHGGGKNSLRASSGQVCFSRGRETGDCEESLKQERVGGRWCRRRHDNIRHLQYGPFEADPNIAVYIRDAY